MTFLLDHILSTMYTNHVYLIKVHQGAVWICAHGCVLCFHAFSVLFFLILQPHFLTKSTLNSISLYGLRVSQIILSVIFFIKNEFHDTIYIFKNYFVTVFTVFSFNKINFIQTGQKSIFH